MGEGEGEEVLEPADRPPALDSVHQGTARPTYSMGARRLSSTAEPAITPLWLLVLLGFVLTFPVTTLPTVLTGEGK